MPSVREELQTRRQLVANLRWDEGQRLAALLTWVLSNPQLAEVIARIKRDVSIEDLLRRKKERMPPPASSPEEVARLGLYLLEHVRGGRDFTEVVLELDTCSPYGSTQFQAYADEAMSRYIDRTLDYLDRELRLLETAGDVTGALNTRLKPLFTESFARSYPETHRLLNAIAADLSDADRPTGWANVGNSCRELLIEFLREVRSRHSSMAQVESKGADVKGLVADILKQRKIEGRFAETLRAVVAAAWDHAQVVTHRPTTKHTEAARAYTWAALSVLELHALLAPDSVDSHRALST